MHTLTFEEELLSNTHWMESTALFHLRTKSGTDDLVQDTLLRCLEGKDKFVMGTNMRAWIQTVMRNHFIQQRRLISFKRTIDVPAENFPRSHNYTPENVLNKKTIEKTINALDQERIKPFLMKMDGFSLNEIGKELDMTEGNVKIRIFRAKRIVREAIAEFN